MIHLRSEICKIRIRGKMETIKPLNIRFLTKNTGQNQ